MLWTYALGQLVNGWLGNRVNTRRMVFLGIVGSAAANFLFITSSSFPMMVFIWLLNGFLQAMGWGPILRSLSDVLDSPQRRRIAGVFGASYVVGNTITWILTGVFATCRGVATHLYCPPIAHAVDRHRLVCSEQASTSRRQPRTPTQSGKRQRGCCGNSVTCYLMLWLLARCSMVPYFTRPATSPR